MNALKPIVTPADVKKVAHLARLKLDETAIPKHVKSLSTILEMIAHINDQDTSAATVMSSSLNMTLITRQDLVTEHNERELLQKLAPQTESGLYLVPQVIE